jgi:hypothetical protein
LSYARREASAESDIDFFIVTDHLPRDPGDPAASWIKEAKDLIATIVPVEPAEGGAFANVETPESMLQNIGGENDTNLKITRRMLFLLEGEWMFNAEGLRKLRRSMLERYISEEMTDHQLALFLLNDVIRYYRTIAVDYEFKTTEGRSPKPWDIRNIKLIFSRKLLYASGLFSVAVTADRDRERKIELLEELFDLPVMQRMNRICGTANLERVWASYDRFLEKLENASVRERLKRLKRSERSDPLFRELKNEGHHFTRELLKVFETTFDSTHPIRRAVIF